MTRTSTQDLQEEFLAALSKGQQTMIGALRIWVDTVQTVTPRLTGIYAPLADRLPKLPTVSVPFADKLPTPQQAVDGAYDLAGELLANQRKFAADVLDTAAPLLPGHNQASPHDVAPKVARQPATVTPAPKPAAPKSASPKTATPKAAPSKATPRKAAAPRAATPKPPAPKSSAS